jgi:FkbM family methyltransferase
MKYFLRLFSSEAFWAAPIATLVRGVHLAVLVALKRNDVISIRFGSKTFRFNYRHGKRYGGGRGLFLFRENIEDLMKFGDRFLKIGDVVIDGGANQGVFTTAFASYVGPSGRVIAIEPMPYAVERVKQNAALNDCGELVHVVERALSDQQETVTLDLSNGVGSASITNNYGGAETVEVETTTIDQLVADQELSEVNFIKLDIEGAELKALHGAQNTLADHRPMICMEISTGSGSNVEEAAHHHLESLGYDAYEFVQGKLTGLKKLAPPHANVFYLPQAHQELGQGAAL